MSANKNAQLRYQILDRCFSNFRQRYTIDDLVEEVNEKLYDFNGTEVSLRQIREDIKFMRDSVGYNAPSRLIHWKAGSATIVMQTGISPSSTTSCPWRR